MSNMNIIIRICVYMHILTVEPSRARGLKPQRLRELNEAGARSSPRGLAG